jgi:hypothetical protein
LALCRKRDVARELRQCRPAPSNASIEKIAAALNITSAQLDI